MKRKYFFIFIIALSGLLSCEKPSETIEKSGIITNVLTWEGEQGVEVCYRKPLACSVTDAFGRYIVQVPGNEYLLDPQLNQYLTDVDCKKDYVSFFLLPHDNYSKIYAYPTCWIRLHISPNPPFQQFKYQLSNGENTPDFFDVNPDKETIRIIEVSKYQVEASGVNDNWWRQFAFAIIYNDLQQGPQSVEQFIQLQSLDTVDVFFNF